MLKTLKGMGVDVPDELADIKDTILNLHENGQLAKSFVACPLMHGTGMSVSYTHLTLPTKRIV